MIKGLTRQEVMERKKAGQTNFLDDNISKSKKQIIREHTLTYFNFLNLFLAIIIFLTGQYKNMAFLGVIFTNTFIGIYQEFKVKKIIDKLSIVTQSHIKVLREKQELLNTDELVLDDIVYLEAGNQIPADSSVLESHHLEVNESLLTGEADAVIKDRGDEVLAGSYVISGSAIVQVIRTGKDNYSSHIVLEAKKGNRITSEMKNTIEKIIKILSIIIIPIGLLLFRAQYYVNDNLSVAVIKTVAGVIGMIPEGLVLLTSISFVLGVERLAKKKALVQQMEAIESLARIDELCLDKTGTITTGDLKVIDVVALGNYTKDDIDKIMGSFVYVNDDENATQKALKDYFKKNNEYSFIDEIPFSSERKSHRVNFKEGQFILGAPEFITDDQEIKEKTHYYADEGYRVLLLGEYDAENCLICCALIIIEDVLREDAVATFRFFAKENVSIRVLSGDNPVTVSRICIKAGIKNAHQYVNAMELSDDLDSLSEEIENIHVFGRVKPEQKKYIIESLQKKHVVAMVGDGINDVLAIKQSDCGIAMANGADAAKQAAAIVLVDSQFSGMKDIVREGRTIIGNIEKVSSLYLTKTIYSAVLSLIFGLLGALYPYTPVQLTLISSFAIGIPSFFITLQKNVKVSQDGFLKHVLQTALPCALSVVTQILILLVLRKYHLLENSQYIALSFLVTNLISYFVVYKISHPLTKLSLFVLVVDFVLSFSLILLFPRYLDVSGLFTLNLFHLIIISAISIIIVMIYSKILNRIEIKRGYYE
ncbi:HAD-IC family P-type ATPase [Eggerthia catenaformis]|uniref:HAD-IC family P-type ATPase n=1 Tax=Eggerthia catenaformis TaxID=31973 RepID=UPI0028E3D043|nr:HAD-IC family P-type ATPase [Eggerthia catenaformis]